MNSFNTNGFMTRSLNRFIGNRKIAGASKSLGVESFDKLSKNDIEIIKVSTNARALL
jgi:hypothetical protein